MDVASDSKSPVSIRPISSAEELDSVARLRYQVYVNELGRRPIGIDDDLQRLEDPEDAYSIVLGAFDGGKIVGTFRITPVDQLTDDSSWREIYGNNKFPVEPAQQYIFSRMIVTNAYRSTGLASHFFKASFDCIRHTGGELAFLHCPSHLVSLYEVMGFRRYSPGFVHEEAGFRIPMVMITGDWGHFESVKSPLLSQVMQYSPNVSLGDWFEQTFPAHSKPGSVRVLAIDEFLKQFDDRLMDSSIPLLDDLNGEEKQELFLGSDQIAVGPGDVLLTKGDGGDAMYLILEGAVEVSLTHNRQRRVLTTLGAGQLFGEAAFLMKTPRSADVSAIADTLLLSISNQAFDELGENSPSVALKVLRNLSRTLCLRLYAGTME
ncbi:MAG: cyclic nucleotide-binding domain-containing protein [Arenimonas sp.]